MTAKKAYQICCAVWFFGGFISFFLFLFVHEKILLQIGLIGIPAAVVFGTLAENINDPADTFHCHACGVKGEQYFDWQGDCLSCEEFEGEEF